MIYAMSDLHGCYEKYEKMLKLIGFNDSDVLFVLGDVVDRGSDGIKILLDLMNRNNVVVLRGNHDYVAYKLLSEYIKANSYTDIISYANDYIAWLSDGGKATYNGFLNLRKNEQKRLLKYLESLPVYHELTVNGNSFFLSHTVPEKEKMLNFDRCSWQDFILGEPEYEKCYFNEKYIVTGHTPTGLIDEKYIGRIYRKNNHIAIDCGACFGGRLGCISLDDLTEFYV